MLLRNKIEMKQTTPKILNTLVYLIVGDPLIWTRVSIGVLVITQVIMKKP